MGLSDTYVQVRGQILLMDPLPSLNKVFSLLTQEERQRQVASQQISSADSTNAVAFTVKHGSSHHSKEGQRKERPYCTHCKYHGHTMEKCYKLHGYRPDLNKNIALTQAIMTLLWLIMLLIDLLLKTTLPEMLAALKPSFKNLITINALS